VGSVGSVGSRLGQEFGQGTAGTKGDQDRLGFGPQTIVYFIHERGM
jgi:hypothetical protein